MQHRPQTLLSDTAAVELPAAVAACFVALLRCQSACARQDEITAALARPSCLVSHSVYGQCVHS